MLESNFYDGKKNMIVNNKIQTSQKPIKYSQANWTENFNDLADCQQKDKDLIQIPNYFDEEEWEW